MIMISKLVTREIVVHSGEVRFSDHPAVFVSPGVGSCVILFIYEPWKKIGGVAHIMVPGDSTSKFSTHRALFANTAPAFLIDRLKEYGAEPGRLKAKIIGGGNMFDWAEADGLRNLGRYNIEQVKRELIKSRIYLAAEEVGGGGKTVKCCTSTGNVYIKSDRTEAKTI
jgi:chemotaxis protein CheD